ncbi:MAG: fibronectin type III domain-containing protein [bacterium]|nr:fibronectin type III domain-containing protein [bacterium]
MNQIGKKQNLAPSNGIRKIPAAVFVLFLFFFLNACGSKSSPPDFPTDLQASAISSSRIDLSWTDNADNEEGFKIERMVSGGAYALVTSLAADTLSYSDTGLNPATTYSYRVSAFNSVGDSEYSNEATATTLPEVIPDTTPPDTFLTAQPVNPTNETSLTFEFASTEAGSTFECQLDSGGWVSCASPVSYTGLSEGNHIFEIRAIDQAGNTDQTPTSYTFTLDTALPVQSGWSPASAATITTKSPTIAFNLNEIGDCKWSLSDEDYSLMVGGCAGDGTTSIMCGVSGLLEGANTVYIACRDSLLNADIAATNTHLTYIVDTAPPVQSGWNPASASTITTKSPVIALNLNEIGDCKWSLYDEDYSLMVGGCAGDGTTSIMCGVSGLLEGANTVYIACRDSLLNADTAATNIHLTYIVDTAPPVQSSWSPVAGTSASPTITLNLNENGDCKWSRSDLNYAGMSGDCTGDGNTSISCGASGLLEGTNTIYIACRDSLGNADTAATNMHLSYFVDNIPPVQSDWSPASATIINSKSPVIALNLNESGDCKWSLTDQAYGGMSGDCTGDGTTSISCGASGLLEGTNTIYIACRDSLLNADTAATNTHLTYIVDTIPPDTSITAQPSNPTSQVSAGFSFTSSEGGPTFECKLDKNPWEICASPKSYPGPLTEGNHFFNVRAIDLAGNIDPTPASYTWLINTNTPPIFSGIKEILALSDTEVMLFWVPATDDATPQSEIVYDICQSDAAGACVASFTAIYTAKSNMRNFKITGLTAGQTYYFLVRARDNTGNRDTNIVEKKREYLVAIQMSAGYRHTCVRLSDNTVRCWGENGSGELGNGTNTDSVVPVYVSGITTAVEISAGLFYTCARLADHTLRCWGWNVSGQLGDGTNIRSNIPVRVSGINTAVEISTGWGQTCARLADNTLRCWGENGFGELGDGTNTTSYTPVTVSVITTAAEISAGGYHTCARLDDNTVRCWGYNNRGQLGDGTNTTSYTPVMVSGMNTAVEISAGIYHTCARLSDDTVRCWGENDNGQLGDGTNTNSNIPLNVFGITTAAEISAGSDHACARLVDNTVSCWGHNDDGELGDGTWMASNTPVVVSGITTAVEISARYGFHNCARLADNTISCWGDNEYGQLGNGAKSSLYVPVTIPGITTMAEISAGDNHTCARLADNTVSCWGDNEYGQLGDGTNTNSNIPVTVFGITTAAEISAGSDHVCARLANNTVTCWGDNSHGQLGNGTWTSSNIPVYVSGITMAVEISAGWLHTCARLADNTMRCWGENGGGQFGNGTGIDSNIPVSVSGINSAAEISAGGQHTCARLNNNTIKCWGSNHNGELGNGTNTNSNIPVTVSGITTAAEISIGYNHTCARLTDNSVRCWGMNNVSQLGSGTSAYSCNTPVIVPDITTAVEISLGYHHTCARLADSTMRCWGYNDYGQLGNGTDGPSMLGVIVSWINTAVEINAGYFHTCARLTDNTIRCWGDNGDGQLGIGYFGNANIPVPVISP